MAQEAGSTRGISMFSLCPTLQVSKGPKIKETYTIIARTVTYRKGRNAPTGPVGD